VEKRGKGEVVMSGRREREKGEDMCEREGREEMMVRRRREE
jgi:hypothetical protein